MRVVLVLASLGLLACSPSAPSAADAGRDAQLPDAGPERAEAFAALGATSEGIAIGRTADGVPVMYVGTLDDRIVRVAPDGVTGDFVTIHDPLGIAVRDDGTLVVCAKHPEAEGATPAIFSITPEGTITTLVPAAPGGTPFALTNFVAIAPDGSIVFSDSAGDRVYRADADGSGLALVTDAITYPNGLAFSPDGATLYVASWDTETLHAIPFDASTGAYGAPTPAITGIANVDGIVATAGGALVLVTSSRGILLVDPATPSAAPELLAPLRAITLPANAVLGDAAFGPGELYVATLGETSVWVVHTDLAAP